MAVAPEDVGHPAVFGAISDADLLDRLRVGDEEAFTEVVTRYQARLLRYLTGLLSDPEQAADVLQETFLDLHQTLVARGAPASLPAWLYRAATNNAIDARRRRSVRERVRRALEAITPTSRDPSIDVDERLAAARALERLSAEDRVCVLLHALVGLHYGEIARVLEISDTAARQRITRAKARFRKAYESEGDHVEADSTLSRR